MLVYVAGPIDLMTAEDEDPKLIAAKALIDRGHVIYRAWEAIHMVFPKAGIDDYHASGIRELNYAAISACHGLFAVVTRVMSVGTVMDLYRAKANGLPVVVWMPGGENRPAYLWDVDCFKDLYDAIDRLEFIREVRDDDIGAE